MPIPPMSSSVMAAENEAVTKSVNDAFALTTNKTIETYQDLRTLSSNVEKARVFIMLVQNACSDNAVEIIELSNLWEV